jgi:adenine-specific DNA-methyltransferase
MRYIGNKTKLLPAIEGMLRLRGIAGGTFLDIFAGTASVARHAKRLGFRVVANDRLWASYVQQVAALEVSRRPRDAARRLDELGAAPDAEGLVTRQYSPAGPHGRRFFTEEHARRIDAALEMLTRWQARGEVSRPTLFLLLAAVIDAADRVANISGTYGAFLKAWQPNTRQPLSLRLPEVIASRRACRAHRRDANELVREVACDVLYIDPPYNEREYASNYHVLEAIAARPFLEDAAAFEAGIYGKTGLQPYEKSAFSDPRRCEGAFRDLVAHARAREVIVSYNEEGILSRAAIEQALRDGLGAADVHFVPIRHRRFRSDADGAHRRYKVLAGRARDEIAEWLIVARRAAKPRTARARRSAGQRTASSTILSRSKPRADR